MSRQRLSQFHRSRLGAQSGWSLVYGNNQGWPGMTDAQDLKGGAAELEKLAGELDSRRYAVSLVSAAGRRPHLHITNRNATVLTENIYVAEGWYWWGWAERIAPITDLTAAAAAIARVLRVVDAGR
jgi:hypothetical protein